MWCIHTKEQSACKLNSQLYHFMCKYKLLVLTLSLTRVAKASDKADNPSFFPVSWVWNIQSGGDANLSNVIHSSSHSVIEKGFKCRTAWCANYGSLTKWMIARKGRMVSFFKWPTIDSSHGELGTVGKLKVQVVTVSPRGALASPTHSFVKFHQGEPQHSSAIFDVGKCDLWRFQRCDKFCRVTYANLNRCRTRNFPLIKSTMFCIVNYLMSTLFVNNLNF